MKKWIGIGTLAVVLLACGGLGIIKWRKGTRIADDKARLAEAASTLNNKGGPETALSLFRESRSHSFPAGETDAWLRIQRDALLSLGRTAELAGLYSLKPELIHESDEARLKLYELFRRAGNSAEADRLFSDADPDDPAWKIAQARSLTAKNIKSEVVALLADSSFEGSREAERVYLLCAATTSPTKRASILDGVDRAILDHPLVRLARARHFEANNLRREAVYELGMALQSSADKLPHIHDAADFFLRNRSSHGAFQIWTRYAEDDVLSWLRLACWSRMVYPARLPASAPDGPPHLEPVVEVLTQLPPNEFFPSSGDRAWHDIAPLQEVLWLQWLASLETGNDKTAFRLLREFPVPEKCFNPLVGRLGYMLLNYRLNGKFSARGCRIEWRRDNLPILKQIATLESLAQRHNEEREPLLLSSLAAASDDRELIRLAALLDGPFAIPLVLLLAGWEEAAIRLADGRTPPPQETALNIRWAQALQRCRGENDALTFLAGLPPAPAYDIAQAESLIALSRTSEAAELLEKHLAQDAGLGSQAAWLLAKLHFAAREFNEALRTLLDNPELALSVAGHELAGQIYLANGDDEEAAKIFGRILPHSPLAQDFVATHAYRKGDLKTASELRGKLAMRFPDRPDLRAHAARIHAELNPRPTP